MMDRRVDHRKLADPRAGFNLVMLSIIMCVMMLIMASVLSGGRAGNTVLKSADTTTKLFAVEQKMVGFMARNGRRPCPADGQYDINTANFGIEAAHPGGCIGGTPQVPLVLAASHATISGITQANPAVFTTSLAHGFTVGNVITISNAAGMTQVNGVYTVTTVPGSTSFTLTDMYGGAINALNLPAYTSGGTATSTGAVSGVIPTKSLGLDDSYAFDEWGRRITYIVDPRATNQITCSATESPSPMNPYTGKGGITIENSTGGTVIDNVMAAYVSHGPDGHGAWPAQGSMLANRINTGTTDADKLTNAAENSSYTTNFTNVKVQKEPTATFGDLVYYSDYYKNACCVGAYCANYGFRADGMVASGLSGVWGIFTGDVNGDGIQDLIIGAGDAWYVVFGTPTGFPNPLPLNTLNGTNGFEILGYRSYALATASVVGVGDVNGDGYADIVLLTQDNSTGQRAIFVLFGHAGAWTPLINNLSTLVLNGTNGFELTTAGVSYRDANGRSGALGVGDINGDGRADLMFYDNTNNRYYFYFGQQCGGSSSGYAACSATYDPAVQADGTHGFYLLDSDAPGNSYEGWPVFADVNGDGIPDMLMGQNYGAKENNLQILFGHAVSGGYWAGINGSTLDSLMDGTHGTAIIGSEDWYFASGIAVGDITDVNSNASPVLILSEQNQANGYGSYNYSGTAYIIPLSGFSWGSSSYTITSLVSGGKAYWITGDAKVTQGFYKVAIADVNGDGINDIILSCPYCTTDSPYGSIYVIYGKSGALSNIDLNTTPLTSSTGMRIDCSYAADLDNCGEWLTTGDVNGDGISDLIINSQNGTTSAGTLAGYTYVLYGHNHASSTYWPSPFKLGTYIQ